MSNDNNLPVYIVKNELAGGLIPDFFTKHPLYVGINGEEAHSFVPEDSSKLVMHIFIDNVLVMSKSRGTAGDWDVDYDIVKESEEKVQMLECDKKSLEEELNVASKNLRFKEMDLFK